jgi:hypothetical protein
VKSRVFIVLLGLAVLCTTPQVLLAIETTTEAPANEETVAIELALAEASRQRAGEAGAEWLETGPLIEQAKHAAENEDWRQALTLALRAKQQGELAVEQAARESVAWRDRVIQ